MPKQDSQNKGGGHHSGEKRGGYSGSGSGTPKLPKNLGGSGGSGGPQKKSS